MTALSNLLQWLAGDWALLIFLEISVKCSLVAGVALLLSGVIAQRRPELAGQIVRQSVLLSLVLPLIIILDAIFNGYRMASELSTWVVALPMMAAGDAGSLIAPDQASISWTYQNLFLLLLLAGALILTARVVIGAWLANRMVRNAGVNESEEVSTTAKSAGRTATSMPCR